MIQEVDYCAQKVDQYWKGVRIGRKTMNSVKGNSPDVHRQIDAMERHVTSRQAEWRTTKKDNYDDENSLSILAL